ncbi:MAG: DUF5060 domain-containing protein [Bryobacteraceae bacterium]
MPVLAALLLAALLALPLGAQTLPTCTAAEYSTCDLVFELAPGEKPDGVLLRLELRSPSKKTLLMPAFHDGGSRLVVRFGPNEAGEWDYKITSSLPRLDNKEGKATATASESPGFIRTANVHHFATERGNLDKSVKLPKPHLWMGAAIDMDEPRAAFDQEVAKRVAQKFTHLRGVITKAAPDHAYFSEIDDRVRAINAKGLCFDLVLRDLPAADKREAFMQYLAARYSPMNITWQGIEAFENRADARVVMKDYGDLLKRFDPYQHPRSTMGGATSSSLTGDQWIGFFTYQSPDVALGAVEHQLYATPAVNASQIADPVALRKALWNATMNGQYPSMTPLDDETAKLFTNWFDIMSDTRHWELEPHFDVDGARAIGLEIPDEDRPEENEAEGIEYLVYIEKPAGPIEVGVRRHSYNVRWINPATGEETRLKDWKGERFVAEVPDASHDWLLQLSRDGKKEGMLRSYKFASTPPPVQEPELNSQKIPYDIAEPSGSAVSAATPLPFRSKIRRSTRATRRMLYFWSAEMVGGPQGARILGSGPEGMFRIPREFTTKLPGVLTLRLSAINANGKVYVLDKVYRLLP